VKKRTFAFYKAPLAANPGARLPSCAITAFLGLLPRKNNRQKGINKNYFVPLPTKNSQSIILPL
jgi:hypothetical protein